MTEYLQNVLIDWYFYLKAFHIIFVISWMAGLLYLPRIFVYHQERGVAGSELSETMKVMEHRLLHYIMTPAMIGTWFFGGLMLLAGIVDWSQGWPWAKAALVILMTGFHVLSIHWQKAFAADRNTRPAWHFRIANEIPAIMMIGIVLLAVAEPF